MPAIDLKLDGDNAWPDLRDKPIIHVLPDTVWRIAVIPYGMVSGKVSVALRLDLPDGQVIIAETSLALLSAAVRSIWARYGDPTQ
jgi:hypothetical protein